MISGKSKQWLFAGIAALVGVIVVLLFFAPGSDNEQRTVSRNSAEMYLPPGSPSGQTSLILPPGQEREPFEDDPQEMALLGDRYFENGQFDQAIELYKKVIERDPKDVDTYNPESVTKNYF